MNSIIINKKDDNKKNNLLWYFQIVKIKKIFESKKKIYKKKSFDFLKKNYKKFLFQKFSLKILIGFVNKKKLGYFDFLKNDDSNLKKNLFNFVNFVNYLRMKKLKVGFKNMKKFKDEETKKYFFEKFSKKLLLKSKLKKIQVLQNLRNFIKERKIKKEAINLLKEILEKKIQKKNKTKIRKIIKNNKKKKIRTRRKKLLFNKII